MLSKYEKQLLCLVGVAVFNRPLNISIEEDDWNEIIRLAYAHSILSIIAPVIKKVPDLHIPEWASNEIMRSMFRSIMQFENMMQVQQKIIHDFKTADIECIVLKGSSVSVYYPYPELRHMGDIDILVPHEKIENAVELLQRDGFIMLRNADKHKLHIHMHKGRTIVEIHHSVDVFPDGEMGQKAQSFIKTAFEYIKPVTYNDYKFDSLSVSHQAISLLVHMARHYNNCGIGLRQLLDWVLFIEKNRVTYEEEALCYLNDFGLSSFAHLMYSCGVTYIMNNEFDSIKNEYSLQQEVIEVIMKSGDLGCTSELSIKYGSKFYANIGKRFTWNDVYSKQKDKVLREYPIVAKVPVLIPLFIAYHSFLSYLRMRIYRGIKLHSLKRDVEKHNKLFSSFKLFE